MSFVYLDVDTLKKTDAPPLPAVGDGSCVALIKYYVSGLQGVPTSAWRAVGNVQDGSFMRPSDNALAFYVIER